MNVFIATTPEDRAACFAVREAVFMGEQGVSEAEEWDGLDGTCTHFLAGDATTPAGCARLLPKGDVAKVQRVAVMPSYRGSGLGRQIMLAILDHARDAGFTQVILDSQTHAVPFYERLGFTAHGPEFDDAGIPHRSMRLSLT
ncbi:GNAT family N-acetyltransferase [Nioella sp. MMSF_3534]|uniref:GNAT family N-acetyltransferase n=1 Tax=Nioella sp. MMSF_3534 TaxID=3046720 RepID=UPI00273E3476|nr:GNAT family N-acetyltransferase [Nioella sp. MMSF_3534]